MSTQYIIFRKKKKGVITKSFPFLTDIPKKFTINLRHFKIIIENNG
jgi:hypothetical protein